MTVILAVIAVLLFGLIIFVHEFGHFFTAKLCGIKVNEFAIGMGPKILSRKGKETQYTLRIFPIGGYCAMEGEDDESRDERAFSNKPVWKRMIVVVTGALMNILFGLLLMGLVVCQQDLLAIPQIAQFTEGSKLEEAGAKVDDVILSVDGYDIYTERDLSFALAMADPDHVNFELERDGEKITLEDVKLDSVEVEQGRRSVQIDFNIYGKERTLGGVITKSFQDTYSVIRMVFASLKGLVTGQFGLNDVSGPVGAAKAITEAASMGLETGFMDGLNNIIVMMVIISVNLGIFNLLPIPALDGGRFVFLLIEGIRRKPIPVKYESYVNAVGFILLIGLMVVVTFKDVWNLFG